MDRDVRRTLFAVGLLTLLPISAFAQSSTPRPRPAAGSVVTAPRELFSERGELNVTFNTTVDSAGRTLFCFMTPDGSQNPTLHVLPGMEWLSVRRSPIPLRLGHRRISPTCTTSAQRWRATSR